MACFHRYWCSMVVIALAAAVCQSRAQVCLSQSDLGSCKCQLTGDKTLGLDLTPLKAKFADPQEGFDNHEYVWGPCGNELDYGSQCSPGSNSAACRGPGFGAPQPWRSLGMESTATYSVNTTGDSLVSTVKYTNGTGGRSSTFTLICDEQANDTLFQYTGENPSLNFNFKISSNVTCLVEVRVPKKSKSSKLSVGSILVLVILAIVAVYIIAGVSHRRLVRGATGAEAIPHRDTWRSLLELISDGVDFLLTPCRSSSVPHRVSYQQL